ncbi:MAG: DUF899 domain-containing protein [Pseudomonadota bacterium]
MSNQNVVTREEWLEARKTLMAREKAFTRERDELNKARQSLPWVKIDENYTFTSPNGEATLADLFEGRSQLIVYHFMFGADWEEGCPSCSFWADGYDPLIVHLNARDVSLAVISSASLDKLEAYKNRMGWSFKWVSSANNNFNRDFRVSFSETDLAEEGPNYNFGVNRFNGPEAPGMSVFYKDDNGAIYHTYSAYARGLDIFNAAYHYLDVVPKGRDEGDLPYPMAWLRRHDAY